MPEAALEGTVIDPAPPASLSMEVKLGLKEVVAWPPDSSGGLCALFSLFPNELWVEVSKMRPVELDGFSFNCLLIYVMRS